jgi:hypothetical protein
METEYLETEYFTYLAPWAGVVATVFTVTDTLWWPMLHH